MFSSSVLWDLGPLYFMYSESAAGSDKAPRNKYEGSAPPDFFATPVTSVACYTQLINGNACVYPWPISMLKHIACVVLLPIE